MVKPLHIKVKGRARFKVEGLYRCESLKVHIETVLLSKDGIYKVTASILTGNVLILYNSHNNIDFLISTLKNSVIEYREKNNITFKSKQDNVRTEKTSKTVKPRGKVRKLVVHAEKQPLHDWHYMDIARVLEITKTDPDKGLSSDRCAKRLKKYGPNILPESVPRSRFSIFIDQFKSLPVALLGIASCISLFTGGISDAIIIMGVVAINATIGYFTESSAEKTIHSLKSLVRPNALVIRDGQIKQISAEDVVLGDLLVLRPGVYVAADARLIDAQHLSIDESALTGESLPVSKTIEPITIQKQGHINTKERQFLYNGKTEDNNSPDSSWSVPIADRTNMVYMGTLVTGGQGIAVVVATGGNTEIGHIQMLVGETKNPETPMERQLNQIGNKLVLISGIICGAVFIVGLLRGYGFLQMLKSSISLAVAAVPEGLPAVATTTLALGIRRMNKYNVLIRRLEAVETLGSIQTICLDKTGTITMNKMTVTRLHINNETLIVNDGRFLSKKGYINPYMDEGLLRLIHTSVLCNESEIFQQNGSFTVNGSPTENALIHMAIGAGVDVIHLRKNFPLIKFIHRTEQRNIMFSWHDTTMDSKKLLAIKGNPKEVLAICSYFIKEGFKYPLTEEDRSSIEVANEKMAGDALRVLGVAYALVDHVFDLTENNNGTPFNDIVWLGILGMSDPIRPGVKELISDFHRAGIKTVMITGDQTPTAYAIAKDLQLNNKEELQILDSVTLNEMPKELLKAVSEKVHVFSRVSPAHKLLIVQSLQSSGQVVAMTGDGINDGPALKAAGIGIAMGHTGTDVAREVADVILEDDNLQTMIIAISQGRTIYNNIRKSIHYLLSTNMSEIMVMFAGISIGIREPLSTMQLLWINLISDIFPGLALALEKPEPDILNRPPRDPKEPIIKKSDFKRIFFESSMISAGTMGVYAYGMSRYGAGAKTNSLGFLSLTIGQLLHSISCRSENHSIFSKEKLPTNNYLNAALAGSFAIQGLAALIPGVRGLLGITPMGILDGVAVGMGAFLPFFINEATKNITKD
ncbi:MAG: cation-transporting P-type ATPase [Syntrophorhabdaceae bacterium]|nr:cation-transporting P-type ATPase [Syntrophorhabdaceae bacterium]